MKTKDKLNSYLIEKSEEQREKGQKAIKQYSERFSNDMNCYVGDIMIGFASKSMSFESNLNNMFAIMSNNMMAAIFAEQKIISLKQESNKLSSRLENEKRLKQTAFLYIVQSGLANQFQEFINNYEGEPRCDIYKESASYK